MLRSMFLYSGAPARCEPSIAIEISKSTKPRKFGGRPHTYVRTHGLGLGMSLLLSLIWSSSYAKSDTKTYSVRLEFSYLS